MPDTKKVECRVVNVGCSYRENDGEGFTGLARKGELITVDPAEAERLKALGAVVGKDEPDPTPMVGFEHARPLDASDTKAAQAKHAQQAAK